ncbi:alpha/beta fold hydrolase [Vibrio sp. 10N.286.48.B7]|uniref:alpha/beta fold hydrolase n=1 Tax=Vibrio sp. 10N.286.48.B7 TaxID=1880853 RepID=UPI0039A47F9D
MLPRLIVRPLRLVIGCFLIGAFFVDLLGSGFSDKPEDFDYSICSHAAYLEAFIQSLGLDKFVIYGHSMGGAVSVVLAEKVQPQLWPWVC